MHGVLQGPKQDSPEMVVAQWKGMVRQMVGLLVQADSGDPANAAVLEQQLITIAQSAVPSPPPSSPV